METNGKRKLISVCISTYEMHGLGTGFLRHNFDILKRQTFQDFDVVVSDQAKSGVIEDVCREYAGELDIRYFKCPPEGAGEKMPVNNNNAIRHATGRLIKFVFLDDFLYSDGSLREIAENFDPAKDRWLVTGTVCTADGASFFGRIHPSYHDGIHFGANTISCPSVLTILNEDPLLFDERLVWLMDSDYYKRCFERFGPPKILDAVNVVNRVGAHQSSNSKVNAASQDREYDYIAKKYGMTWSPANITRKARRAYSRLLGRS